MLIIKKKRFITKTFENFYKIWPYLKMHEPMKMSILLLIATVSLGINNQFLYSSKLFIKLSYKQFFIGITPLSIEKNQLSSWYYFEKYTEFVIYVLI